MKTETEREHLLAVEEFKYLSSGSPGLLACEYMYDRMGYDILCTVKIIGISIVSMDDPKLEVDIFGYGASEEEALIDACKATHKTKICEYVRVLKHNESNPSFHRWSEKKKKWINLNLEPLKITS